MVITMVENFKITAKELKRQVKISIYLPKNYNDSEKNYPLLYVLDGQMMFHSLDDGNKTFDFPTILDDCPKECICVGIHAPKLEEWRISELCPYYRKDESLVDSSLAFIFADYFVHTLHPIIQERYRITEDVFLLGFTEGAIFNLYALSHYALFKGAGIFSPRLENCEYVLPDLDKNFDCSKAVYLYFGGKNAPYTDLFYSLYSKFEELHCEKLKLIYEEEEENGCFSWQNHLKDFLLFLLP